MMTPYVTILIMCIVILATEGFSRSVRKKVSAALTTQCSLFECMYDALPAIEGDGQSRYDPVKTCYTNGEYVYITCSGGLIGRSHNLCVSGVWSYSFGSRCEASCSRPIVPNSDAISTHPNVQDGGHLTVTCNDGYTISGTGRTVLLCENGILYPDVPTCYASCSRPKVPNSHVIPTHPIVPHGGVIIVTCNDGSTISGTGRRTILLCDNGILYPDAPTCVADCKALKNPENGVVNLGENPYDHRQEASFRCNDGFTLVGNQEINCYDGLWDGDTPMCLASCNRPVVPNSDAISTEPSVQHGGAITVTCKAHYADGDRGRTVLFCDDGTLYPNVPSCEKVQMSSEDIAGVVLGVFGTVIAIVAIVVEIKLNRSKSGR